MVRQITLSQAGPPICANSRRLWRHLASQRESAISGHRGTFPRQLSGSDRTRSVPPCDVGRARCGSTAPPHEKCHQKPRVGSSCFKVSGSTIGQKEARSSGPSHGKRAPRLAAGLPPPRAKKRLCCNVTGAAFTDWRKCETTGGIVPTAFGASGATDARHRPVRFGRDAARRLPDFPDYTDRHRRSGPLKSRPVQLLFDRQGLSPYRFARPSL